MRKGLCAKGLPKGFTKECFFEKGFVRKRFAKKFCQRVFLERVCAQKVALGSYARVRISKGGEGINYLLKSNSLMKIRTRMNPEWDCIF